MTLPALPSVAAYAAGVQTATLRQWVRRGHISPPVDGCYDLDEILVYSDERNARHFHRAVAGRTRRGENRDCSLRSA